ncbi:hypothetical protein BASA50_008719 [Batrachochytrium salamandrivorans]|uniref:B box-type domain-containing protein n=1 Tax=Batrachochytrium salamandrivorans TaxID=1357716 RepID=A0ABQ8F3C1_9FUNG|nr:hypothetical protein BASA61_005681 [Batrachochytrium salamandrivorans]KAH6591364.1 hypothetical protein BASA50_008719 [Batrachochytrium salamandrivorans]
MLSDKSAGRTQLAPTTPEFAQLEYDLQLTLHSSTVRVVASYAISNPHVSGQFERRSKDILVLPAWIDSSAFGGINTEEDVVRRGFRLPPPSQGLRFTVGRIDSAVSTDVGGDTLISASTTPGKTLRKAMLCLVAVGRSFVADETMAENEPIPVGYDSFHIQDPTLLADAQPKQKAYEHTYFIKNPAQVLPQYIVHYDYDPLKEKQSREKAMCDNCEDELATVYCTADAANLCNKCDTLLHQTKLASRHTRSAIGQGTDVFGNCRHHPEKSIEFFCSLCHVPVCVFCKMVGNHANGEAARHQLVSVTEAYHSVLQEAQVADPILQSRRTEITNQISAVNSRARSVEKMGSQIEQQVEEMYQRAMRELKLIIQSKLTILLGDELELRRQIGEIDRLEEFLKYQQFGDATTYLFSWSRHQNFRAALHDFKYFQNEIDVQLDAKVSGSISVVVDQDKLPNTMMTPQLQIQQQQQPLQPPQQQQQIQTQQGMIGGRVLGMGVSHKLQAQNHQRRVQRRTSDFFAEALGSFDQVHIGQGSTLDEDDMDHMSGVYRHD